MRWKGGRRSGNIDDRRGRGPAYGAAAVPLAALRLLPALLRSKTGRIVLVVGILVVVGGRLAGIDVLALLAGGGVSTGQVGGDRGGQLDAAEEELADFAAVVLADTEDAWDAYFAQMGRTYSKPTLVLFSGMVNSACGSASAAVGPFYCPGDRRLYLDLSFFRDLATRYGAPGDFAQAYVIAHEVGHHVQTLLGISDSVRRRGASAGEAGVNALSVRQELQADCFAGLWGFRANLEAGLLEPGDLEEALSAASAIGDDRLQREAGRRVVPDSFTHGTSAQRVRWFRQGFTSGDIETCDTYSVREP